MPSRPQLPVSLTRTVPQLRAMNVPEDARTPSQPPRRQGAYGLQWLTDFLPWDGHGQPRKGTLPAESSWEMTVLEEDFQQEACDVPRGGFKEVSDRRGVRLLSHKGRVIGGGKLRFLG